jgi:hypothetical protein
MILPINKIIVKVPIKKINNIIKTDKLRRNLKFLDKKTTIGSMK